MKLEFSRQFFDKNTKTLNFKKIRPVGAQLFHADRRPDGRTDMKKLIIAFRSLSNALKKSENIIKKARRHLAKNFSSQTKPMLLTF